MVQIIRIHTRKKPLAEDVIIEELADHTDGYTGADNKRISEEFGRPEIRTRRQSSSDISDADIPSSSSAIT
jgi:ATP-dependent 26S proteasome regulatory subunit